MKLSDTFQADAAAKLDAKPDGAQVTATTCYMCACRCGIHVHHQDGKLKYIEGNPDHPVNRGVLCAKGSAGIMQHYSPARLSAPLLRVGPRGSGKFKEIGWDEALALATRKMAAVRKRDPKKLAFFTGRDQSQALTGWWAKQFGTPNYAAHGGFCSVNMAAAGLYTIGGSFWEFGESDWAQTRYFMMFGVAEDHDSNPIKIGIGQLKARGDAKFVSVNPVRSGYSAVADEWVGIRPGTDGLLIGALIGELLRAEQVDWTFLARYTNAGWLVIDDPGAADHGLFARGADALPLCHDQASGALAPANALGVRPAMVGRFSLPDGRGAVPAFQHLATTFLGDAYGPDAVAQQTGVSATVIRRLAAELAQAAFEREIVLDRPWVDHWGRRHEQTVGRPVAFHAMRGISAHSNGFDTCRMIHVLQMLLGAVDGPGAFQYKPPFPRATPPRKKPARGGVGPERPLDLEPLGFPTGPEDLAVDDEGQPTRIDKAFSWQHPLAVHGMMHMLLHNAWAGDPYPIDVLFLYMSNMAWNSSMNVQAAIKYLTDRDPATGEYKIPFVIYSDAYHSETVAYADLVLPDTTYLERWDAMSMLDRPIGSAHAAADSIRQPVLAPDRDVRPFQDVLLDLGARLGLPGMVDDAAKPLYHNYADYLVRHERMPGIGTLAGWRGADGTQDGRGDPNPQQLQRYVENGCFWECHLPASARYYRFANRDYLAMARAMGWSPDAEPIVLQLYSEVLQKFRLAGEGHGPVPAPQAVRPRLRAYFHPIPRWLPPLEESISDAENFPLSAITQRPMHMYHSWGSQNAWLRQITTQNHLYIHHDTAAAQGIGDGDWVWLISPHGRVRVQAKLMAGVNPGTVWTWNAIGKRRGAWKLAKRAPEMVRGFLLNHVISEVLKPADGEAMSNSDPVTGQAAWFDVRVRLERRRALLPITSPLMDSVGAADDAPPAVLLQGNKRVSGFRPRERAMTGEAVDYVAWQGRDGDGEDGAS